MRVLKIAAAIIVVSQLVSCSGALSPRAAFEDLRVSIEEGDSGLFKKLLTSEGKRSLQSMCAAFSDMKPSQLDAAAQRFGMSSNEMRKLDVDGLAVHYLASMKNSGFGKSVFSGIESIKRSESSAVVRTKNGADIEFVKEGAYWKISPSSL